MGFPGSVLLNDEKVQETTTDKRFPLGTRGYTRDGRTFYYSRNGATALKAGVPLQSAVPSANEVLNRTGTTKLKANSSKIKIMTSGTGQFATANAFADGYLYLLTSATAKGSAVYAQIKSHSTQTLTATGVVSVYFYPGGGLYSPTTVAGNTNAKVGVQRNPFDKVVVKPSGVLTALPLGVPVRLVAANAYFWMQTWGACPVRCDTTAVKIGTPVGVSTNTTARYIGINSTKPTSGAITGTWTVVNNIIAGLGVSMVVGVSGEYRMIFLKIAP